MSSKCAFTISELVQDWGYNTIRPLAGALPDDFSETRVMTIPLDADRGVATLPWGTELRLQPFFGVMGVAPPSEWGAITSIIPRRHGGNLDNKELGTGATLYLPIHVDGALFSAGDGHGVQGDGEVCVTAIETALEGNFRADPSERISPCSCHAPRPETHVVTMGLDPDLDDAATEAVRDMIALILRANQSLGRGCLHALQPGRGFAGHPDRQPPQGCSHDAREVARPEVHESIADETGRLELQHGAASLVVVKRPKPQFFRGSWVRLVFGACNDRR